MSFLITGGAGFIGSHLTEALLGRGESVTILDNLTTGAVENTRGFKSDPKLTCVFDSVTNARLLAELIDEADAVIHLAAAVGVRLIVSDPLASMGTNIRGTEMVLDAAAKKGKAVFIASTSEVYGKSPDIPFREDGDLVLGATTKGRWSYACAKAIDEFLALAYWRGQRLPVVVGRFFNIVGPRQTGRYGMVLPSFVNQALEGKPLTVYGSGRQSRCFCYVTEAVEAVIRLVTGGNALGEVVNIGNDQETTIEGLAELVKERITSPSQIERIPYEQAYEHGFEDMLRRTPCVDKLERLTGYRPSMPLTNIVDKVALYFEGRRGVIDSLAALARQTVESESAGQSRDVSQEAVEPVRITS